MQTLGEYIKEHKPTNKQLDIIRNIEQYAPKYFTGVTKRDAFLYIQKYIDYYTPENTFEPYKETKSLQDLTDSTRSLPLIYGELDPYEYELDPYGDGWGGAPICKKKPYIFCGGCDIDDDEYEY